MPNSEERAAKPARLKVVMIVLAILLVLSAGGLVARYVYLQYTASTQTSTTVPDNLIGDREGTSSGSTDTSGSAETTSDQTTALPTLDESSAAGQESPGGQTVRTTSTSSETDVQAAKIELYQGKAEDNRRFEARNMLPGDKLTQYFCVKAYHDADLSLFFRTQVTQETKDLGEVLHIRVTHLDTGKVLCDAPFADIQDKPVSERLPVNEQEESIAYYEVEVSLDTSVGNEYQEAMLKADFQWYVEDEGGLKPPPTGDTTNLVLWTVLAGSSFLLIILLLVSRRRRKEAASHG